MKKIKYLLFTLLSFILIIPAVYAAEDVKITSIKSEPTYNGLEMNFDVAFKTKGDYAKYKVTVKNDSNKDYQISEDTSFNASDYITYKYEVDGELKANSEKTFFVTITYNKEVDNSLVVEGKYNETNKAIVQLSDEKNPNTSTSIPTIIIIAIALSGTILILLTLKKNNRTTIAILLLGLFLIPVVAHAIETLKLTMNVKVEIEKGYEVAYLNIEKIAFTDEEADKYIQTESTECLTVYVDQIKYNVCSNTIVKDSRLYVPGETVNLRKILLKYIDTNPINPNYCELQEDNTINCTNELYIPEYENNSWAYYLATTNEGELLYPDDKEVMNFESYDAMDWQSYGYLQVNAPQTFTMPSHDVLFHQHLSK